MVDDSQWDACLPHVLPPVSLMTDFSKLNSKRNNKVTDRLCFRGSELIARNLNHTFCDRSQAITLLLYVNMIEKKRGVATEVKQFKDCLQSTWNTHILQQELLLVHKVGMYGAVKKTGGEKEVVCIYFFYHCN